MAKKKALLKRPAARSARSARKSARRLTPGKQLLGVIAPPQLRADEDWRGIIVQGGKAVAHVIEHRKEIEGTQAECKKMADDLGADYQLPDCQEAALCYANGKKDHQQRYYWTREDYPGYSAYAYVQDFALGYQFYGHEDLRYVGRAVRRVAI